MERVFKTGQLVYTDYYSDKGFGIITDIIDINTGESFYEIECITGFGDMNTKVKIEIDLISIDSNCNDISSMITMLDNPIKLSVNPHSIYIYTKKQAKIDYDFLMERMDAKMAFIEKYSLSRDDKINILLDDKIVE